MDDDDDEAMLLLLAAAIVHTAVAVVVTPSAILVTSLPVMAPTVPVAVSGGGGGGRVENRRLANIVDAANSILVRLRNCIRCFNVNCDADCWDCWPLSLLVWLLDDDDDNDNDVVPPAEEEEDGIFSFSSFMMAEAAWLMMDVMRMGVGVVVLQCRSEPMMMRECRVFFYLRCWFLAERCAQVMDDQQCENYMLRRVGWFWCWYSLAYISGVCACSNVVE
jgi:hypothetical protein